ncbi:hypothetical protein HanPI659440_Chr07g0269621 [Helianthus annuus]|nr:hypothetical protein HanPI659440_Chr07g0269621 [Helianthus annuus]
MILVSSYMFTGVDIQWILASLLISNYKTRYILDAGRRSSSLENRTRYRYTLPHIATL